MPQETNLNVAPYFDDFDAKDTYCKILFKPGLPVQARELTGIQSILQSQIEKFGQHIFKDGASVLEVVLDIMVDMIQLEFKYLMKVLMLLPI